MVTSFKEVVDLWETPEALAADVRAGVAAVRKWRQRNRIPARYWHRLEGTSTAKSRRITVSNLAKIAAFNGR